MAQENNQQQPNENQEIPVQGGMDDGMSGGTSETDTHSKSMSAVAGDGTSDQKPSQETRRTESETFGGHQN